MPPRRLRQRKELNSPPPSASISAPSNRPRRAAAQASVAATASAFDRETDSPDEPRGPTKLKIAPSKLRQAEQSSTITVGGRGKGARESFEGGEIMVGSRPRRKPIVEESSEEEDDDEEDELAQDDDDEEEDEEDDDAEGDEDEAEEEDDDDDEDAEAEDVDMDDIPPKRPAPAAAAVRSGGAGSLKTKPSVTVTPAKEDTLMSVEDKEMAMDDEDEEDEELSELDSQDDGEGDEIEDDGEGEEVEDEDEEMAGLDDEDPELDSDLGTPGSMSRSNTPDPSKLTRRQRGEVEGGGYMALSNEAQKKKHLTAEEHAARRAEMARRRKNLSEKRNEEEKMDTINRLLKKQAPKRRTRREIEAEAAEEAAEFDEANPPSIYVRWVNNASGSRVAVTNDYMQVEDLSFVFKNSVKGRESRPFQGRMVEEIEVG